jgi:prolyl-tRNA editing enzyme YbaK/EbsC (Cys-tRNA(Pro) deacylase)
MTTGRPRSVDRVADYLRVAGAEARLEEFSVGTPTAQAAADAVGCGLDQIVKSLVFVCDGDVVLALVPGDRRADSDKVAGAAGAPAARIAKAREVEEATGFPPGGVAPFGLPRGIRVVLEQSLLSHPVVWAGGGSDRHMVRLSPRELARLTRAEGADLVQDAYDSPDHADADKEP